MTRVTVYYLQTLSRDELRPAPDPGGMLISEARGQQYQLNRSLYELVGGPWQWVDKLNWSAQQWRRYVERDQLRTWVAAMDGRQAGYFELLREADHTVNIAYFGLAPAFIGRGLGGYLLSNCLEQAWDWRSDGAPTRRVTVETCSLDHPGALHNYQARGMRIYRRAYRQA